MHKIYIASSLSNWKRVRGLWEMLDKHDVYPTYDWTSFGEAMFGEDNVLNRDAIMSPKELGKIGWDELKGVMEAEYLLVILPGGRGTHVELGSFYTMHCMRKAEDANYRLAYFGQSFADDGDESLAPLFDVPITMLIDQDDASKPTSFHYMPGIKRTKHEEEAVQHILDHRGKQL